MSRITRGVAGVPALAEQAVDSATGLPLGHLVCLNCQVTWGYGAETCWICDQPGLSVTDYNRVRKEAITPPPTH